jgi:hypothetical protein
MRSRKIIEGGAPELRSKAMKPLAVGAAAITLQLLAIAAAAAPITVQLSLAQLEQAASLIRGLGYPCTTITRVLPASAGPQWLFRVECGREGAYLLSITPMGLALRPW